MNEKQYFEDILNLIVQARTKAIHVVTAELINLYWNVGKYISEKTILENWGKSIVVNLSIFIKERDSSIKGFSSQNLWRMKQFYETYSENKKLSSLTREISWTNNLLILSKSKTKEEREFYLKLAIRERYSSRELKRQIDSGVYERFILSDTKASAVLREIHPKSVNIFKDNYILDFLDLPKPFAEKDLRTAIVNQLKDFILEFGKDFAFVGQEYRLQVGKKDFSIDLVFFQRALQCLVAFDLKITDYKPEYLGKMEFYLEVLDRDIKKDHEKPSVGIILCKSKDTEVVEYSLSRTLSPTLVSQYETKLIDKKLLAKKLNEFYELADEANKKDGSTTQ